MSETIPDTGAAGPTEQIRANTVLRARREDIELHTEDGLTLVGELATPEEGEIKATLVMLHPLPTHGGYMDSHVFKKAANRLPALAGIALLRFNFRGVTSPRGTSEGTFGGGDAEGADVRAALDFVKERGLPNVYIVGWSFGTDMTLRYGHDDIVNGAVLLSPPLKFSDQRDLRAWAQFDRPLLALVPQFDDYLRPVEARRYFSQVDSAVVKGVDGAKHLWVGETFVRRVLQEIVDFVAPGTAPLPAEVPVDVVVSPDRSEEPDEPFTPHDPAPEN